MKILHSKNLPRLLLCKIKLLTVAIIVVSFWNDTTLNSAFLEIENVEILNLEENVDSSTSAINQTFFKVNCIENVFIWSVDIFAYFSTSSHSFSIKSERSPPFYV